MRVRVTSYNVFEKIAAVMQERVTAAGNHVAEEMTRRVSTPGPPRSEPFNPPHVDRGKLHKGISSEETRTGNTIRARVVIDVPYAGYLEFGTSRMQPRPFIAPTIADTRPQVELILRGRG